MNGAPVRANRDGHLCPPWCVADHDAEPIPGQFLDPHSSEILHVHGQSTCAVLGTSAAASNVQVCTSGVGGGSLFLEARHAGYLACLVEAMADATPAEHRKLAAAIRQAAAQIAGAGS